MTRFTVIVILMMGALAALSLTPRHHKTDRLNATFEERWKAIEDLNAFDMPALRSWRRENRSAPVVGKE
jgi:hypothetical protein